MNATEQLKARRDYLRKIRDPWHGAERFAEHARRRDEIHAARSDEAKELFSFLDRIFSADDNAR